MQEPRKSAAVAGQPRQRRAWHAPKLRIEEDIPHATGSPKNYLTEVSHANPLKPYS